MKRSEPLRADPAKTRAWQERSRAKAAENARERAQGREGMKSAALRRATAPTDFRDRQGRPVTPKRQPSGAPVPDAVPPPVRFRAPSPARRERCARCSTPERPVRATGWHHLLPQQHIRVYVRGLRLSDESARPLLRRLLADRRNLLALCSTCHDAHELRARPLSADDVPHSARVFALELGPEWAERLRLMYPPRSRA